MNLTVKKNGGLSSLFPDFLNPNSLLGRDFFNFDSDLTPSRLGINLPTANVSESPKEFKLELAAPGLQHKDFNIEIENNILTISVEQEEEKKEEDGEYSRKEYSFHSFSRTFTFPENVKESGIEARYVDGILKVTIPKEKETPLKPVRKIAVT